MTEPLDLLNDAESDFNDALTELKLTTAGYTKTKPFPPGPNTHWGKGLSFYDAGMIKLEQLRALLQPTPPPPPPPPVSTNVARFLEFTGPQTDNWFSTADQARKDWMNAHYFAGVFYPPYSDPWVGWFDPPAHAYADAYAIYVKNDPNALDPQILRDMNDNPVFIPWDTPPTQYAADIGDFAWRQRYIERCKGYVTKGYGIFVDDCNVDWSLSATPKDERTGQPMTKTDWRRYMAEFMEALRSALPSSVPIMMNTRWFDAGGNTGTLAPEYARVIIAADCINIERGVIDSGLTAGTGQWSIFALFRFVDQVHALGTAVHWQSYAGTVGECEKNLAAYWLTWEPMDYVSSAYSRTSDWWAGYSKDAGQPLGKRTYVGSLHRREFEHVIALLNDPGASAVNSDGVTIAGGVGKVIAK